MNDWWKLYTGKCQPWVQKTAFLERLLKMIFSSISIFLDIVNTYINRAQGANRCCCLMKNRKTKLFSCFCYWKTPYVIIETQGLETRLVTILYRGLLNKKKNTVCSRFFHFLKNSKDIIQFTYEFYPYQNCNFLSKLFFSPLYTTPIFMHAWMATHIFLTPNRKNWLKPQAIAERREC